MGLGVGDKGYDFRLESGGLGFNVYLHCGLIGACKWGLHVTQEVESLVGFMLLLLLLRSIPTNTNNKLQPHRITHHNIPSPLCNNSICDAAVAQLKGPKAVTRERYVCDM